MRSVVLAAIVFFGVLVTGLVSTSPGSFAADEATPVAATPDDTDNGELDELCSDAQLELGETVFRAPPGKQAGSVTPDGSGGERLFLVVMTLPPGSCIGWRERDGAVIVFVQQGTIDYTGHAAEGYEDVEIWTGDSDDPDCIAGDPDCTTVEVAPDETITVHANEWVTQDRPMLYTFRNGGAEDAIVSVASYVSPWNDEDPCHHACRHP